MQLIWERGAKMARDAVTAVRDIAAYLTVGEWCLIMAGVKKAVERMTQEEDDERSM